MSKHNHKKKKKNPIVEEIELEMKEDSLKGFKLNLKSIALTPKQKEFLKLSLDPNTKIMLVKGPSGSAKSFCSIYSALRILCEKPESLIKYVRTTAESGERSSGFLPGTLDSKTYVFNGPLYDKLSELLPPQQAEDLLEDKTIEPVIINYLRGASFRDMVIVADECFSDSTYVKTTSGKACITQIVANPSGYKVISYNERTKQFEPKRVLNGWKKEKQSIGRLWTNGKSYIECTANHKFLTTSGWKEMCQLKIGDFVLSGSDDQNSIRRLNDDQLQLSYGSVLGDGCLSTHSVLGKRIQCIHGIKQVEYARFKADVFDRNLKYIEKNGYAQKPAVSFSTKTIYEKIDKNEAIDKIDFRGLAISWMDDGTFDKKLIGKLYSCATSKEQSEKLSKKLKTFGYDNWVRESRSSSTNRPYYFLYIPKTELYKMAKDIAPYCHESMAYKFPEEFRHLLGSYKWDNKYSGTCRIVTKVELDVKFDHVYDIEVEDNHNFLVSKQSNKCSPDLIAHNCQNFTLKELITLTTRIGNGTRIYLVGDPDQADIGNKSGFQTIYNLFNTPESVAKGIHCFEFFEEDIMRSEILKYIVSVFKKLPNQNNGNGKYQI